MNESAEIDLTPKQRAVLLEVLAPYADRLRSVAIYGSRATGHARRGSDVDLALFGADDRLAGRLLSDLEDSDLSIFADVVSFDHIRNDKLRQEIERDARTLFTADELRTNGPDALTKWLKPVRAAA